MSGDEKERSLGDASSLDVEHRDVEKADLPVEEAEEGEEIVEKENSLENTKTNEDDVPDDLSKHLSRKSTKRKGELQKEKYPLTDLDKGLVGWDSQDDPLNPRNFKDSKKWSLLALISGITLLSPFASSVFAPGVTFMNEDFNNTSDILTALAVSIFVLGFAVGPLLFSPLSEIYGRAIVLNGANIIFVAFGLGCALAPNLAGLLIMRFLAGVGGSACLTIGTGVIADMFVAEQRGLATAMYSLGILFGPVLGPICGGFIAERAGWRWDFWVTFIASALVTGGIILLNKETNPNVLIGRKTIRLQKELNRPELKSVYTHHLPPASLRRRVILSRGIVRPLKLLFTSPIVFLLSLYVSFVFGLLYLLFTTITSVYVKTYGWAPDLTGLAYLGIGIGFFFGIIFVARTSDATIIRLAKANNNVYEPEMRLVTCVFFGMLIPISFFWYGWAADKHTHWIVPIIGLLPFGFGMMGIFAPIQTYLIDAFPEYAASAVAALTAFRCLFGAMLPLAAPKMYQSLGLGWGNSLLGFVALALIPAPLLMYKYGGLIRKKYPVKL